MSLSKNMSIQKTVETNNEGMAISKTSSNPVVRINQDSDDNLKALFDTVLNPSDSKRPLQVPFRMRKLPNSFFNPPPQSRSTNSSHSRTNSVDSAYDPGSQSSVNQTPTTPAATNSTLTNQTGLNHNPQTEKIAIFHSRAHSSPASLQQSYSIQSKNTAENVQCPQIASRTTFADNVAFPQILERNSDEVDQRNLTPKNIATGQTFHMKQRSYNVISPIQLYNELGDLPPGWEQARTNDGQIYYLNHNTKTTQWEDPRIQIKANILRANQHPVIQNDNIQIAPTSVPKINDNLGPLPEGWEQAMTESGDIYFINHINRTTSWNDPRIPDFLQKTSKIGKPELQWINVRDIDKDRVICKTKQETNSLNPSTPIQVDPFLSGDNHSRQESSDSGLSLSSNTFSITTNDFLPNIDDSMDCINDNDLNGIECPEHLVSSLQIEDNICDEMFEDVNSLLNTTAAKAENLEWYKIN